MGKKALARYNYGMIECDGLVDYYRRSRRKTKGNASTQTPRQAVDTASKRILL